MPSYWVLVGEHYMSCFPVMPAILSVPVYALPVTLGLTDGEDSALGYTRTEIVGTVLSKIRLSGTRTGVRGRCFTAADSLLLHLGQLARRLSVQLPVSRRFASRGAPLDAATDGEVDAFFSALRSEGTYS